MLALDRSNNFTALRILCATAVLAGHYLYLSTPAEILDRSASFPWADLGVQIFFVTSGLLVTLSWAGNPAPVPYLVRRFLRIYPLYAAAILMQAAAMTAILVAFGRFEAGDLVRYLGWNAVFANFRSPDMGGLLSGLVYPAINPSLWTLKLEILFYLSVPILHPLVQRFGLGFLALVYVASTLFFYAFAESDPVLARQLPGQMRFFVVGMAIAYYGGRVLPTARPPAWIATLAAAVLLAVAALGYKDGLFGLQPAFQPLVMGAFVIAAALMLPPLPEPPDLSYGVYLFHGPLVQLAILFGLYDGGLAGLAMVAAATFTLAWLGHCIVEAPAIEAGRRAVRRVSALAPPARIGPIRLRP